MRLGHRPHSPVLDSTEALVTGADTRGHPVPTLPLRLLNLAASIAAIAVACTAYWAAPYNRQQLDAHYGATASFSGTEFLVAAALAYSVALAIYFLSERAPAPSKTLRFWRLLAQFARSPGAPSVRHLGPEDRVAVLSTLLKAFFGPMMVMWVMVSLADAMALGSALASGNAWSDGFRPWFDRFGFPLLLRLILIVDVLWFTVGYLVELPALRNQIRSVDPTWTGWFAALLCYPPFNQLTVAILGSELTELPQFANPTVHLVLCAMILVLMGIYASASVALGLKASNLTHRGIVTRGPYRVIRHPAYTCKNMAWWIGSAPLVSAAFAHSTAAGLQAMASVAGWTLLYVLRALTEEEHLRGVDGDYAAYCAKVRWRFVPGLF
jgi:protein-S-isoprenylcysteine O-methyltransferase Ste14